MKPWRERVIEAEQRGTFTEEDLMLSQAWGQCAVGEQQALYPDVVVYSCFHSWIRGPIDKSPVDNMLWTLGVGFNKAVHMKDIPEASRLLDQIEDRVLQLKRAAD